MKFQIITGENVIHSGEIAGWSPTPHLSVPMYLGGPEREFDFVGVVDGVAVYMDPVDPTETDRR